MNSDLAQIDSIVQKVDRIISDKTHLEEMQKIIVEEKKELTLKLSESESKLEEIQEQLGSLMLAHKMTSGSTGTTASDEKKDITELKKKIDHYVNEIDKCITILNN